jgi:hypothetical protein
MLVHTLNRNPVGVVPAACANAVRHATWALLRIPVQSTAQIATGLSSPKIPKPIASRLSHTDLTGVIYTLHKGCSLELLHKIGRRDF